MEVGNYIDIGLTITMIGLVYKTLSYQDGIKKTINGQLKELETTHVRMDVCGKVQEHMKENFSQLTKKIDEVSKDVKELLKRK